MRKIVSYKFLCKYFYVKKVSQMKIKLIILKKNNWTEIEFSKLQGLNCKVTHLLRVTRLLVNKTHRHLQCILYGCEYWRTKDAGEVKFVRLPIWTSFQPTYNPRKYENFPTNLCLSNPNFLFHSPLEKLSSKFSPISWVVSSFGSFFFLGESPFCLILIPVEFLFWVLSYCDFGWVCFC